MTKQGPNINPHSSHRHGTDNSQGLIFDLDSAVIKAQNFLSSHEGFLTYAMHHHK